MPPESPSGEHGATEGASSTSDRLKKSKLLRQFGIAGVIAASMVTLLTWAVVSPIGSDPDGSFHLTSILCGGGYDEGLCEPAPPEFDNSVPSTVMAPVLATYAGQCFAFQPHQSAACEEGTLHNRELVPNTTNNLDRLYPNLYYSVSNLLVFDQPSFAPYFVRLMNSSLAVVLFAGLWFLGPRHVGRSAVVAALLLWVPLGLFLVASNNGSSWTLIGVGAFWAYLWAALTERTTKRSVLLWAGVLISGLMGAGSRVDGALYVALSACLVVVAQWRLLNGRGWRLVGLSAATFWLAAAFIVTRIAGQTQAITTGLSGEQDFPRSLDETLFSNALRLPGMFVGFFGIDNFGSGLGWLDTPMPPLTWAVMVAVIGYLVATRSSSPSGAVRLVKRGLAAMVVFLPSYVLFLDRAIVIQNVQARYILPLATVLFGVHLIGPLRLGRPLRRASISWMAVLVAVAHSAALHTQIRRYTSGLEVVSIDLTKGLEWWPSVLPSPNVMWVVGSLAMFATAHAVLSHYLSEGSLEMAPPSEPQHHSLSQGIA